MYIVKFICYVCVCVRAYVCTCVCQHLYVIAPCHLHFIPLPLSPSPPPLSAVEVEPIDPYDLLDPVDLLAQMPKDFYDNIVRSHSESSLHLWIDVLLLLLFWFGFCTC